MNHKTKKISDFCINVRKKTGLSQNAFAKKNNISHTKVNRIENGDFDINPSPIVLARIADVYGFDINDSFAYGIKINEEYIKKLNNYRLAKHTGTPSLTGNELLDTFKKLYIDKEHSSSDNWNIVIDTHRDYLDLDDSHYCMQLREKVYNYYGFVYCIKNISTINSNKDKEKIDTLLSKIILNSLTETYDLKKEYKAILIVTGSEKIYKYIINKYKNKIHNLKYIDYQIFYCSYGKYKNNIIDDRLNKNDFWEFVNSKKK